MLRIPRKKKKELKKKYFKNTGTNFKIVKKSINCGKKSEESKKTWWFLGELKSK